ncbi:MAG: HD domain-containing protein [Candidatus Acidiferrales bacterium]
MVARPPLSARFQRALVYAARIHSRQSRKGTTRPYMGHLLGVTSIVLTQGGDEDEAIAALLHDAVEDQGGKPRLRDIQREFGARVARIVEGCTDSDSTPKPPWLTRKKSYLQHLLIADSSVRLVSAADKVYNARETLADFRSHRDTLWKRFKGGKRGTLWYYREVAKVLRRRGPQELGAELDRIVKELTRISKSSD